MYKVNEANHLQTKNVQWERAELPQDDQCPTVEEVIKVAKKRIPQHSSRSVGTHCLL